MKKSGKNRFPGGVHPTDGFDKALTMDVPIQEYSPAKVTILAEQSPGGKCQFVVRPGELVKEGDLIGEPKAFMAAPLHASAEGKVLEIKEIKYQDRSVMACVIQKEKEESQLTKKYEEEAVKFENISKEQVLSCLYEGGLTGMGGAGFPTYRKYETEKKIDALLINGAECEPFLTCDYRLMLEKAPALINGVRLLLFASGAKKAYICLEDNKPKAEEKLTEALNALKNAALEKEEAEIEVKVLPTKYPQGGERQLIQAVLGREVPMGGLPADVGVIVTNVGTAKAAADMVLGKKPLTRRIVTVSGCVKNPGNFLVPVGTAAGELIQLCGGVTTERNQVIQGGPMTSSCMATDFKGEGELFYVTKNTSGILVLPSSEFTEQPCIRCGGCASVCPAGLVPFQIEIALFKEDYDLCEKLYASECIACGCCSYICPAKRNLARRTRQARDMVKQRMRERTVK